MRLRSNEPLIMGFERREHMRRSKARKSYSARVPELNQFCEYVMTRPVEFVSGVLIGSAMIFGCPLLFYAIMKLL